VEAELPGLDPATADGLKRFAGELQKDLAYLLDVVGGKTTVFSAWNGQSGWRIFVDFKRLAHLSGWLLRHPEHAAAVATAAAAAAATPTPGKLWSLMSVTHLCP